MNIIEQSYFPREIFDCYFDKNTRSPLVISPHSEVDLITWHKEINEGLLKPLKNLVP